MEQILDMCEYFFRAHQIPVYLYRDGKGIAAFPEQPPSFYPTADLSTDFFSVNAVRCSVTMDNLFIGYIPLERERIGFVLGPVSPVPYTEEQLAYLCARRGIPADEFEEFTHLVSSAPVYSYLGFLDIILFLNLVFNGKKLAHDDFFQLKSSLQTDTAKRAFMDTKLYSETLRSDFSSDGAVLKYIEAGNTAAVSHYLHTHHILPHVDFGATPLTNRKNLAYYAIALFSEAARRGGLSAYDCAQIAAAYYNDIGRSSTVEKVNFFTGQAAQFYAAKVTAIGLPSGINDVLLNCIQYVRHNVYNRIQVSDIASFIGYSRAKVTRMFVRELGLGPGEFIMRTKLEEAKLLMKITDKSLSEISSSLGFCDQSHFQRRFKQIYQMTPLDYRLSKGAADEK